ncbi:MAG: aminotransferase class I/II-fold pyridoxal phosphate-dependent enzyme [Magnetovibrio sp.]|nr:aminotransferase class I/II-fold pyridoxal phosphate-dependent enzyme [Magnetovibrio sp.]
MALKVSSRGLVPPFIVMDVMREANALEAAGEGVLHLEVGQPGTGAPAGALAAVAAAVGEQRMGYTDAFGIPELRERIARHYQGAYGIEVDAANIVVTTGSSGAFVLSFLAAFDAGDRVALASPGYPAYRNILTALGIEVVDIAVGADTNFQLTAPVLEAVLEAGDALDGLIVASPSNPTGTMLRPQELQALVGLCDARGIRLISDEIYHGITYGVEAETAWRYSRDAVVINSFSKYYSMTGWRLGWMVLPDDLLRAVECLGQNLFISPPAVSQVAGLAAFECTEELDANVRRYAENRALLLDQLPKAGFRELASADGAFYIYADVGHLTNDSADFCRRMLEETHIAATPGTDFDPTRGHRYMRFSFSGETEVMAAAAERLRAWLD